MRYLFLFMVGLASCTTSVPVQKEALFDLDSLLDAQRGKLTNQVFSIKKTVLIDENEETNILFGDSAVLEEEFNIIRDLNINLPRYIGAFDIGRIPGRITYKKKAGEQVPVEALIIETKPNQTLIKGIYYEDKQVFQHKRTIKIRINSQGLISNYHISGFQKMIFRDTVSYQIDSQIVF